MCEIQCVSVMSRADRGGVSCLSQIVDRDSRDTENRSGDAARRRDAARATGPRPRARVEAQAVGRDTRVYATAHVDERNATRVYGRYRA